MVDLSSTVGWIADRNRERAHRARAREAMTNVEAMQTPRPSYEETMRWLNERVRAVGVLFGDSVAATIAAPAEELYQAHSDRCRNLERITRDAQDRAVQVIHEIRAVRPLLEAALADERARARKGRVVPPWAILAAQYLDDDS